MNRITVAVTFYLLPTCLCAQWLHFRQPGISRTPAGDPDLTAPLPHASDGNRICPGFGLRRQIPIRST